MRRNRTDRTLVALLGLFALPFCVLLALGNGGHLGLFVDSVAHADAARNLADGNGLVLTGSYPFLEPLGEHAADYITWPPAYPALLAGFAELGSSPYDAAHWVQVALLGANIVMVGMLAGLVTRGSRLAALVTAGVFALSPLGVELHAVLGYEPLFVLLVLAALLALARYLESGKRSALAACGAAVAVAPLVKYAAPPLIGTAVVALLLWGRGTVRTRVVRAGAFAAVTALPLLAWMVRNAAVAATSTGRTLSWHPVTVRDLRLSANDVSAWVAPTFLPTPVRVTILAALAGAVVLVLVAALRRAAAAARRAPLAHAAVSVIRVPAEDRAAALLVRVLGVFVVLFVSSALAAQFVFDALTPLNSRLFVPAYAAGLPIAARAVWLALRAPRRRAGTARVAVASAVVVLPLIAYSYDMSHTPGDLDNLGADYAAKRFTESPITLAAQRWVHRGTTVYSNAPEAVFYVTGRRTASLPVEIDPLTDKANPDYEAELAEFRRTVAAGKAVVVYFERVTYRPYVMREDEILHSTRLRLLEHHEDGAILG